MSEILHGIHPQSQATCLTMAKTYEPKGPATRTSIGSRRVPRVVQLTIRLLLGEMDIAFGYCLSAIGTNSIESVCGFSGMLQVIDQFRGSLATARTHPSGSTFASCVCMPQNALETSKPSISILRTLMANNLLVLSRE